MCRKLETIPRHFSFLRLSCFKLLFISEMLAPSQMYSKQLDSLNLLSSVLTSSACGLFLIGRRNYHVPYFYGYNCMFADIALTETTFINSPYQKALSEHSAECL